MSIRTTEAVEFDSRHGLKLLSLDAGGAQAVSQLQILKHVMSYISQDTQGAAQGVVKRPCEVFDAIGGVGTGGLIAIFLAVLMMTVKEALEEFTQFAIEVYKDPENNPEKQTERLKRTIYGILEKYGVDKDATLISANAPNPTCRMIVPIMYKNNVGVTCVLRNYVVRHDPPTNLTVAEAMLSTCSTAPMFTPTSIGKDFATFEYISGDLGLSNPVREVITNVHHAFGDEATVACLLSIGCGYTGANALPSKSDASSSIDFLERIAMDSEKTAQEVGAHMSKLTLYHRLSVAYGLESISNRMWREPETIIAHTTVYLNDLEVAKNVGRCIDAIKTGHASATLEQLRHAGGSNILPPPLPPLTPNYVERKVPMEFVERSSLDQNMNVKSGPKLIVVTGIGGCGKTQLVRKFVERHGNRFLSIFFVDGSSIQTIRHDIVHHVRSLSAAHSQDSFDDSMVFLSQSILDGQRLLFIDNVDDPTLDLAPFLPWWLNGLVIVTSRNASRGQLSPICHLQLDVMSLEESVELLVRGCGRGWPPSTYDEKAAITVAKELACHPIALVQAISCMLNTGYSAETYISRLCGYRNLLLMDPATNQVDMRYLTVYAAFDASYELLPPASQKLLHLLSFFHWQNFPLELVILAAENDFSIDLYRFMQRGDEFEDGKRCLQEIFCPLGRWSLFELDKLVTSLRNQSIINVVDTSNVTLLRLHSLAHEWSRLRMPPENVERLETAAVRLLCCGAVKGNYSTMRYLSNHVQAFSSTWIDLHPNDAASFGSILQESGLYNDATKLLEVTYGTVKGHLGEHHEKTITASAYLAATYGHLGRHADAEALEVEVLRQRKQLLGAEHPDTINASGNLAITYCRLGRYADAEALEVEVLRQRKQLLGAEHPATISASANLAATYSHLGRRADAEALEVEVLRQRKQLLGAEHPATIRASANLAATYSDLGRHADAEALQVEVLRQQKQLLGAEHPDTIDASANLAVTYDHLGRYADAEALKVEVLRQRKQLLGAEHPDTINASGNLAITYCRLGRYADAEALEVEVLRQRKQLLGAEHPATISASANLAATYSHLGRYADADALQVEVLRQRKRLLGAEHPGTIDASGNLAIIYGDLGRYNEAEMLLREVLRLRTSILGEQHPDTITAMVALALALCATQNFTEASRLAQQASEATLDILGDRHPLYSNACAILEYVTAEANSSTIDEGIASAIDEPKPKPRWCDRLLAWRRRIFS